LTSTCAFPPMRRGFPCARRLRVWGSPPRSQVAGWRRRKEDQVFQPSRVCCFGGRLRRWASSVINEVGLLITHPGSISTETFSAFPLISISTPWNKTLVRTAFVARWVNFGRQLRGCEPERRLGLHCSWLWTITLFYWCGQVGTASPSKVWLLDGTPPSRIGL